MNRDVCCRDRGLKNALFFSNPERHEQPPQHLGARPIHFFTAVFWMPHVKADARGRSVSALFPFIGVTFSFVGLNKYPNPDETRARESV
jgi:hypothetical protein